MANGQTPAQNSYLGLSGEQLAKIIYDELSKSGFQLNNFNVMVPSIISRVLMENGKLAGGNISEMLVQGMMNNFFKLQK